MILICLFRDGLATSVIFIQLNSTYGDLAYTVLLDIACGHALLSRCKR